MEDRPALRRQLPSRALDAMVLIFLPDRRIRRFRRIMDRLFFANTQPHPIPSLRFTAVQFLFDEDRFLQFRYLDRSVDWPLHGGSVE